MDVIDLPKSLMLYTPGTLELVLRCPLYSVGDEDRPDTAESTLVSVSTGSTAAMVV